MSIRRRGGGASWTGPPPDGFVFQEPGHVSGQPRQLQRSTEGELQLVSGLHGRGGPGLRAEDGGERPTGESEPLRRQEVGNPALTGACLQVSVSLQPSGIRVSTKDGGEERTLMEGEFTHKINTENSLWSLEPGKCVVVRTGTEPGPVHQERALSPGSCGCL